MQSVNERLGFAPHEKLVVINADDAGMCCAVNQGVERAMSEGLVTSCTVMAPCPWFDDFAARVRRNPRIKLGVHLTTTSEWQHYRWGPVSPRERVPSLLDEHGYLHASLEQFLERMRLDEMEIELRAQIERVLKAGLRPTHLDSHMGIYHFREETNELALRLAEEYHLCLREAISERVERLQARGLCVVDRMVFDTHDVPLEARRTFYTEFFSLVTPGVTELITHPAEPSEELRAIGGMWQRRGFDLEFFTNPETAELIASHGIRLVGYDQLQAASSKALGWERG
jgi:chitin disaccharide deacetylase